MKIASKKFIKTPPTMISRRCQAGFEQKFPWLSRLFHLLGIHRLVYHTRNFHISPKGTQPIPYSVSLFFGLNLNKENHGSKNM